MIYLIKSAGYGKDNNYIDLLKIGYTEDNKKDKRFLAYKLHNPTCKILYEISSLSEDIEKRIQYKFRSLKYKDYGNEWFYYSDDIVNFFRDIDKMDLESLPKSPKSEQRKYWKIEKMIKEVVSWISEITDKKKYIEKIIDELGSNLNTVQDVLDQIGEHDRIKSYYNILKPQKLKALGYDRYKIERELGIVTFSKELLINTILSKFNIGDRIPNSDIKDILGNLYSSISYIAIPKATDLEDYFEIKKCKVTIVDRGRINALEIVGVKPEYQGTYNNLKIINSQL